VASRSPSISDKSPRSTMPMPRQQGRYRLSDDLARRDAARGRMSTQVARKALRHLERDRNRALGRRRRRRAPARKLEVAISLPARQAERARQRRGRLAGTGLIRQQALRRSQSFGLLRSRRMHDLTQAHRCLRLPRQRSRTHGHSRLPACARLACRIRRRRTARCVRRWSSLLACARIECMIRHGRIFRVAFGGNHACRTRMCSRRMHGLTRSDDCLCPKQRPTPVTIVCLLSSILAVLHTCQIWH